MSMRASIRTASLEPRSTSSIRWDRGPRWLAAACATALAVGLMPILTASPASATPDPCNVTITPSGSDDSVTLGQTLDAALTAADGACSNGATFFLGTTPTEFEYQLPWSLNWTSDDTLAIIGINDDTPILLAGNFARVLAVTAGQRGAGPQTVDLTRLSIRGGRPSGGDGGGVFLDDSTVLTLRQMEFLDNRADNGGSNWGGAVRAEYGTIIAITSRFESNYAEIDAGALGALHLDIQGSEFLENSAGLYGGAIESGSGGTLNVGPDQTGSPSRFIGNFTEGLGGAIYRASSSSNSLIEAHFERNRVTGPWGSNVPEGGAIVTEPDTTQVHVTNSTFIDDSSVGSGAAVSTSAPLLVTSSTFIGASALARGGAIVAYDTATIQDSYFEGNSASSGGAIAGDGAPSVISVMNSTFWGNSADDSGTGVYTYNGGSLSVTASTFDDSTTNSTSLIAVDGSASATLEGTILSKDDPNDSTCEGTIGDSGGNLVTGTCGAVPGTSVVSDDSLGLLPPALNQTYPTNTGTTPTIGLAPSSIAINHYENTTLNADQRGVPRPQGALDDAGAYEAGGIEFITPPASRSASVGTPFTLSLSATGFDSGTFVWDDSGTTLPPGLTLSSTGVISGTPTTPGTYPFTARVTGPVDDSTTIQTITVPGDPDPDPDPNPPSPNPPGPAPATPASPPQEVRAIPAIEAATVSWTPPASTGSFPITSYEAVATPGGQKCTVSAPALTCTITGLTAGTSYTVSARAWTEAGWSTASSPGATVVPLATPQQATILITSSRDRIQKSFARIEGTTTGLVGAQVVPYIRVASQTAFKAGTSTRTVDADGKFTWQRKANKRFTVYFTSGNVTSNRLVMRPE